MPHHTNEGKLLKKIDDLNKALDALSKLLTPEIKELLAEHIKLSLQKAEEGSKAAGMGVVVCCNAE